MSAIGGDKDAEFDYASIRRTPMHGIDRRYTVTFLHPTTRGFHEFGAMTLWGARRYARRVDRNHAKARQVA